MTSVADRYDAAVIGGGMVGMSLAVALAKAGMQVAMVEKTAMSSQLEPEFDGRVSAVSYGSRCILDSIGVWENLEQEQHWMQPILDIRVSDGDMPFFLHYDHKEAGEQPFGYIVENRHMRFALQQSAQPLATLTCYEHATVTGMERDDAQVTVRLHTKSGDKKIRARLLIGADGKHSSIRSMAGIKTVEWAYKQTAIVCTIEHEKPHHGLAQERFLPAGPFAVLPMCGNRSSLVWVEPEDHVELYMQLPQEEFVQEITERVGPYLGTINAVGSRFTYPLSLMHAQSYTGHRLALIGDAAHSIHPIAGQGVNLGFRDVGVLAELLIERFRLGMDIGAADVLAQYQCWRRFDNVTMLAVTDGLNRLFSINLPPVQLARDLGMWVVGKLPPVKRFFMKHAMGLVGDLPQALKKRHKK